MATVDRVSQEYTIHNSASALDAFSHDIVALLPPSVALSYLAHTPTTTDACRYSVKVRPAHIPHDAIAARELKAYIKMKEQEEKDKEYKRKRDKKEGTAAQRLSFFGMYVTQKEKVEEEDIKSEPEDHELMVEVHRERVCSNCEIHLI